MSDKLLRDEILRSHRYQSISNDTAKLLFLHLVLSSDGLSNAEGTTTALSLIMRRDISEDSAASLLGELHDRDLIRIYYVLDKRYVHIPRSRQRIRYIKGKHPRPPVEVEDNEIKELLEKVGLKSDLSLTQVGRSRSCVVVDVKKKQFGKAPVDNFPEHGEIENAKSESWAEHWTAQGKAFGIIPKQGETTGDYCRRVIAMEKSKPV
jgi:hypothetical protein